MDWVYYWICECDFGTNDHFFTIHNRESSFYVKDLTFPEYLELHLI